MICFLSFPAWLEIGQRHLDSIVSSSNALLGEGNLFLMVRYFLCEYNCVDQYSKLRRDFDMCFPN